jgi:hypothetical protein
VPNQAAIAGHVELVELLLGHSSSTDLLLPVAETEIEAAMTDTSSSSDSDSGLDGKEGFDDGLKRTKNKERKESKESKERKKKKEKKKRKKRKKIKSKDAGRTAYDLALAYSRDEVAARFAAVYTTFADDE